MKTQKKVLKKILTRDTLAKNRLLPDDATVTDVCDDSRKATNGSLFVAITGNDADGKKYIDDAIANGAKYILSDYKQKIKLKNATYISSRNARRELAYIASHFFENNLRDIVAVTGTNGKSSTVDIIRQIWAYAGRNAASIGTLGVISSDGTSRKLSTTLTCPGPIELHRIFESFEDKKNPFSIAMEASSHGLSQFRLDYVPLSVCAFTNFSQDHLDYHENMENYWNAKERLFRELATSGTKFVANADDPKSRIIRRLRGKRGIEYVDYGYAANAIKIIFVKAEANYQWVSAEFFGKKVDIALPLFGKFQVYNSLCAAATCHLTGVPADTVLEALEKLRPINGRLELVSTFCKAKIYVDYAHTPDALKTALSSLREHKPKRIITVFGCGGDRDKQKRPLMGKIAEQFSDIVIVTDDNPRTEFPETIREEILKGTQHAKECGDRRQAIEMAIELLQPGDFLLIAGKGHENYQIIGKEKIRFSDKEVVWDKILSKVSK